MSAADKPRQSSRRAARPKRARSQPRRRGFWGWVVETYATADPRSLGIFRILFAIVLLHDVVRRWPDLAHHYSNAGWLTNHFAMFRPMSSDLFSLYLAFSTPAEVKVMASLHLLVNFMLLLGWHTKLMQILAFALIVSLNSRNSMLENGGFVVVHLLALWSLFLPLGRRFSVDALLKSLKQRREGTVRALNDSAEEPERTRPVASLAVTVLILQFATIYYFNVVHKTGPSWRDGTAVYYFFQQDRMVTLFGAWLRHHVGIELIKFLTWSTLAMEALIALFLVSPVQTKKMRMVGWALVLALHLSIDLVVQLGPFSYAMFVVHAIFIPREFWEWAKRRQALRQPCMVYLDQRSGFSLACARLLKRLLPLGSVQFVGLSAGQSYAGPNGEFKEAVTFGEATRQLVVTDRSGIRRTGTAALLAVCQASLPLSATLACLRLGFVKRFVDTQLTRMVRARARLGRLFGVDSQVGVDARQAKPSPRERLAQAGFGWLGTLVLLFFVLCCTSQVLVENRAIPKAFKPSDRPEWMVSGVVYPRLFQGWSMFAPDPPKDDGKIVVEGRTKDGRRFDPLTQKEPDYDLNPEAGFAMNQLWGDFHRRIWHDRFRAYQNGVRDYLRRHHEITGRPENELVAFEVYYVSEVVPPPGTELPVPRKQRLFSWGNMKPNNPEPRKRNAPKAARNKP